MSQGIMEKNLPVAESIQSGDKIRIVTSAGNSKQVDASQIGGGGNLILTETVEEIQTRAVGTQYLHTLSATYNEIVDALMNGNNVRVVGERSEQGATFPAVFDLVINDFPPYEVTDATEAGIPVGYYFNSPWTDNESFYSETADGAMTYTTA